MSKQMQNQAKATTQAISAPPQPGIQTRTFAAQPNQEPAVPDLDAAAHLGHSLNAVDVHHSAPLIVQPKLRLGPVKDKFEEEADRVAAQVVGQISAPSLGKEGTEKIQRKPATQSIGASPAAAPAVTPAVEAGIHAARGGG